MSCPCLEFHVDQNGFYEACHASDKLKKKKKFIYLRIHNCAFFVYPIYLMFCDLCNSNIEWS